MRAYAILEKVEDELVDVWEISKEPLELLPSDGYDVYIGYSDLDWPFEVNRSENWKYWEGTKRIHGYMNLATNEFKDDMEVEDEFDWDLPDGWDEYIKCQDYKNGEPVGEIYYE